MVVNGIAAFTNIVGDTLVSSTPCTSGTEAIEVEVEINDDKKKEEKLPSNLKLDPKAIDYPPLFAHKINKEDGTLEYKLFINGPVPNMNKLEYLELFHILDTAEEGTVITIYLKSPGGSVEIGSIFGSLLTKTKALVRAVNVSEAYSIAAYIWSVVPEQTVDDGADFLFHMSSHGAQGFSTNIEQNAREKVSYMTKHMFKVSLDKGFITLAEFNSIVNDNKTVIISAEEMRQRMQSGVSGATESITAAIEGIDPLATFSDDIEDKNDEYNEDGSPVSGFESMLNLDTLRGQKAGIDLRSDFKSRYNRLTKTSPSLAKLISSGDTSSDVSPSPLLNIQQMGEMLWRCVPISIVKSPTERNLFIPPDDVELGRYAKNLMNYFIQVPEDITFNVYTYIEMFDGCWTPWYKNMIWFFNCMREMKNTFIGQAHGILTPAASVIHLYCDEIVMTELSRFSFTSGVNYKGFSDFPNHKEITEMVLGPLVEKGALLQSELDILTKEEDSGKVVFVDGEEMMRRLNIT